MSIAATVVTGPHRTRVGRGPFANAENVSFTSVAGDTLRGWFIPGRPGRGAIVLMHGIHDDRRSMIGRARFLMGAGYGVLLFDFHAEGESSGRRITFGATEAADAAAAVAYLRRRAPGERIGAIGVSMGGAAALLGKAPLDVDALVLESVYPTIDAAVRDRLAAHAGPLGTVLGPLFLAQLRPRFGIDPAALRPIDRIAQVHVPLLVMAGTADRDTHLDEAQALFARAHEPKTFWAVPGAGHEDLHAFDPSDYERRVLAFFGATLPR
ncbi:MAG TPA: alpha/beta hydrolase [Gemmatimonadaceae bacterium]|nr:alpha/beta hydrolase [Gemmatimonadaceae bacterium]